MIWCNFGFQPKLSSLLDLVGQARSCHQELISEVAGNFYLTPSELIVWIDFYITILYIQIVVWSAGEMSEGPKEHAWKACVP